MAVGSSALQSSVAPSNAVKSVGLRTVTHTHTAADGYLPTFLGVAFLLSWWSSSVVVVRRSSLLWLVGLWLVVVLRWVDSIDARCDVIGWLLFVAATRRRGDVGWLVEWWRIWHSICSFQRVVANRPNQNETPHATHPRIHQPSRSRHHVRRLREGEEVKERGYKSCHSFTNRGRTLGHATSPRSKRGAKSPHPCMHPTTQLCDRFH